MLNAEIFRNKECTKFGYAIWEGSIKLHESECIYSKEAAAKISESVIEVLTNLDKIK